MAKCSICGKKTIFGKSISHSHRKNNRQWKANIKKTKINTPTGEKKVHICTSCLRSQFVKKS